MSSTTTPNMGLTLPVVSNQPGPTYAVNVNDSLTVIDGHTHAPGSGVQITPSAINISSDLPFGSNNITQARSVRFSINPSPISLPADVGCAYVSGVDLYYNDGVGNQVRITQSGGIAGSPGSITGLVSPASATYAAPTFVFQSGANIAATIDGRNIILRNASVSSFGLTLQPPAAMASSYNVILPVLPPSLSIMAIDSSGNITAPNVYPITSSSIAVAGVQRSNMYQVGTQTSPTITKTGSSTSLAGICSVSITTTGRPVMIMVQGDHFSATNTTGTSTSVFFEVSSIDTGFAIDSTLATRTGYALTGSASSLGLANTVGCDVTIPAQFVAFDTPSAGTWRYALKAAATSGALGTNNKWTASAVYLVVYEL